MAFVELQVRVVAAPVAKAAVALVNVTVGAGTLGTDGGSGYEDCVPYPARDIALPGVAYGSGASLAGSIFAPTANGIEPGFRVKS